MKYIKKKYKLKDRKGETRVIRRFLFFPLTLNFQTRWLEWADIIQSVIKAKSGYKWKSQSFK